MDAAELFDRIEQGTTTEAEAEIFARMVARLMRYETTLRYISRYCGGDAAMHAAKALALVPDVTANDLDA